MVGRQGRHPAPVVDPGIEQAELHPFVREVRRRLHVHAGPEQDPGGGHHGQELLLVRLRGPVHGRPRFGPEVLDDDLLHMPVPAMEVPDREQRLSALSKSLPDTHQDAGGERDGQPAGVLDGPHPHGGDFVR